LLVYPAIFLLWRSRQLKTKGLAANESISAEKIIVHG